MVSGLRRQTGRDLVHSRPQNHTRQYNWDRDRKRNVILGIENTIKGHHFAKILSESWTNRTTAAGCSTNDNNINYNETPSRKNQEVQAVCSRADCTKYNDCGSQTWRLYTARSRTHSSVVFWLVQQFMQSYLTYNWELRLYRETERCVTCDLQKVSNTTLRRRTPTGTAQKCRKLQTSAAQNQH